jgi:hypothetical protein
VDVSFFGRLAVEDFGKKLKKKLKRVGGYESQSFGKKNMQQVQGDSPSRCDPSDL